jgi:hypothetical protein
MAVSVCKLPPAARMARLAFRTTTHRFGEQYARVPDCMAARRLTCKIPKNPTGSPDSTAAYRPNCDDSLLYSSDLRPAHVLQRHGEPDPENKMFSKTSELANWKTGEVKLEIKPCGPARDASLHRIVEFASSPVHRL